MPPAEWSLSRIPTARTPTMILIEVDHFTHFFPHFPRPHVVVVVAAVAVVVVDVATVLLFRPVMLPLEVNQSR